MHRFHYCLHSVDGKTEVQSEEVTVKPGIALLWSRCKLGQSGPKRVPLTSLMGM